MLEATITITDPVGLHARPAAVLVRTVGQYQPTPAASFNSSPSACGRAAR